MKYLLTLLLAFAVPTTVFAQATRLHSSGTLPAACSVGNVYIKTGSAAGFYACVVTNTWSGPLSALSSLTPALVANTVASGNNHSQIWNWALSTDGVTALKIGETTASSSGTLSTQALFDINTLATSTAVNFRINNFGLSHSMVVNDVSGDTSAFVIDNDGKVGINVALTGPTDELTIGAAGTFFRATSGTDDFTMDFGGASDLNMGTRDAISFGLYVNSSAPIFTIDTNTTTHVRRDPTAAVPTSVTIPNSFLHIGNVRTTDDSYWSITFGHSTQTNPPAYIAYFMQENAVGRGFGDLVFATRSVETDTAATIRMTITEAGAVVAAGNVDAASFSAAGDSGGTGTTCSVFTGGLCTTAALGPNVFELLEMLTTHDRRITAIEQRLALIEKGNR